MKIRKLKSAKILIAITIFIFTAPISVNYYNSKSKIMTESNIQTKHVIIWTEARSGSTLLADILERSKSVYYISEPINTLAGWGRSLLPSKLDELTQFLKRIINCDFSKPKGYWKKYREYRHYQNVPLRDLYEDTNLESFWNSSVMDEVFCKASSVILAKQIVLPLKQSIQFLENTSLNSYILHLVRDPRSLLSSRLKLKESNIIASKIPNISNTTTMCKNLKDSLDQAEIIKEQYPKRYLRIRYEDLTREAEFTIRQILAWIGLPYNAAIAATIAINTLGFAYNDAHQHTFSTFRDSSSHQHAWRKQLGFLEVLNIQKECSDVMGRLGYRNYNTSYEYTDLTIHSADKLSLKLEL